LLVDNDQRWRQNLRTVNKLDDVVELIRAGAKGICYHQKIRRFLNEMFHDKIFGQGCLCIGSFRLKVGLKMTVQNRIIFKGVSLYRGEIGTISAIDGGNVTLDFVDRVAVVPVKYFTHQYWQYSYCQTAIATQGDTYDTPVIIFELGHMTPNTIYTTITRPRQLDHVWLWVGGDFSGDREIAQVRGRIEGRIQSHKGEDRQKGRLWIEGIGVYVDVAWVERQLTKQSNQCWNCSCELSLDHDDDGVDGSCYSIDRINDNFPHTKKNCRLACHTCNVSRANIRS